MPQVLTDQLHTLFMIIGGGHEEYAKKKDKLPEVAARSIKSNEFKKNLPEGKFFKKALGESFEAEAEDYKKEIAIRTPDYEDHAKRAGEKKMDFSLMNKIVEVITQSAPLTEKWTLQQYDEESHQKALDVLKFMKRA